MVFLKKTDFHEHVKLLNFFYKIINNTALKYQLEIIFTISRTYLPSEVPRIVELWRTELGKVSEKAGQSLADPKEYSNLFPDYAASLKAEQMLKKERSTVIPAKDYMEILVRVLNFH